MARPDRRLFPLVLAVALASGCSSSEDSRLAIVTSNDVSGKTSPCGCHTPKGGLARRAAFLDSVRAARRNVLAVDAGGFFPETADERDAGPYLLQAMAKMGTQVAGVGRNELRFGYAFVRAEARAAGMPLVCSNLVRSSDGEPAFEPWRMFELTGGKVMGSGPEDAGAHGAGAGGVKVGVFGLLAETADPGPARDSLRITGVEESARRAVRELQSRGAVVIVLLSQLGKSAGDSLALHVPGIDLLVSGGGVPMLPSGMPVGGSIVIHGGHQGWQLGVADVRLASREGRRRVRDIQARTVELGPEFRTQPAMAASVKTFEDSLNARLRARDAALSMPAPGRPIAARFVGKAGCLRCHAEEYVQWQSTPHAHAWKTLEEQQKESTPACVRCHVTGRGDPGGFTTAADSSRLGGVQCEACHGMGTRHREWVERRKPVAETVCRSCHTSETSPTFEFAVYRPHVLHHQPAGLRPLPESPARRLMRAGKPPHRGPTDSRPGS